MVSWHTRGRKVMCHCHQNTGSERMEKIFAIGDSSSTDLRRERIIDDRDRIGDTSNTARESPW